MIPQEEYQKEIDRQRSMKHNANKKARKEIARRLTKTNRRRELKKKMLAAELTKRDAYQKGILPVARTRFNFRVGDFTTNIIPFKDYAKEEIHNIAMKLSMDIIKQIAYHKAHLKDEPIQVLIKLDEETKLKLIRCFPFFESDNQRKDI